MKFIADEMIEDLAPMLKKDGIDCKTVHEVIGGSIVKGRKISDQEIREFMLNRKANGESITLVTRDRRSCRLARGLGLDVIYVQDVLHDFIVNVDRNPTRS